MYSHVLLTIRLTGVTPDCTQFETGRLVERRPIEILDNALELVAGR